MSWAEHHARSERLAIEAELKARTDLSQAHRLYLQAAQAEKAAFDALDQSKSRTRGITAVSAVSLLYKAKELASAETLALEYLPIRDLPEFAITELKVLLKTIWSEVEIEASGMKFSEQDILVSVRGGEVVTGGAPLDLILRKVEEVRSIFYRTIEFLMGLPFRSRGGPSIDIQQYFRPWLFQAPPGSYQFAVRLESPKQIEFNFIERKPPTLEAVTNKFIEVLTAASSDPEQALPAIVPDLKYRGAFLKLTRSLAPNGKSFSDLVIRSGSSPTAPSIHLKTDVRELIHNSIQQAFPQAPQIGDNIKLKGILRAVHLDDDWMEVTIRNEDGREEHVKVEKAGDAIDDIIGPMINKAVLVDATRIRAGKYIYRDIQADE